MHQCSEQSQSDYDHGKGADRGIDPITDLAGEYRGERALRYDREDGCVVVFEGSQKGQDRGRRDRWFQKRQQDAPEHLHPRCPKIKGCLLQSRIETLKPCQKDQHRIRRNEGRLTDDGQKKTVVEKFCSEDHSIDSFPEDQG